MRHSFAPMLCLLCLSCGREFLPALTFTPPPSTIATTDTATVRLTATFSRNDTFRFSDRRILTETTSTVGGKLVSETKTTDGILVTGPDAKFDLKADLGRFLTISPVNAEAICETAGPVASVDEVDPLTCSGWARHGFIHTNEDRLDDSVGRAFIVRTESDTVFKLRIVENGRDAEGDFVRFEYTPVTPICPQGEGDQRCLTTHECCNRRHTCRAGSCQY